MRIALITIGLLLAATAWAGPHVSPEPAAAPLGDSSQHRIPPGDLVAFWSQTQDFDGQFAAWSSEFRPNTTTTCESADDFYSENGDTVVMVDWWGHERDFPAGETVPEITEFIIRFCENDTTSPYHVPGAVVYEEHVFDFTAEYIGLTEKYYYSSEIPGGFVPDPGETYWLSIVAINPSSDISIQWYWYECDTDDYWGAEGTLKSLFLGYPEWTPWSVRNWDNHHVEMAFILYSRGDTPVEDKSWAQIKAMFR